MAPRNKTRSLNAQRMRMSKRWPGFEFGRLKQGLVIWRGHLRPKSKVYEIAVFWHPTDGSAPYVMILDPVLKPRPGLAFDEIPHLNFRSDAPEESGLCLFDPDGKEWDPSQAIADTTIPWASEWLLYYELWHLFGEWLGPSAPGPESAAEMRRANVH